MKKDREKTAKNASVPNMYRAKNKSKNPNGKKNESVGKFAAFLLSIFIFILIITGGINQRQFVTTMYGIAQEIGQTVSSWFEPDGIEVNEDGIYWKP